MANSASLQLADLIASMTRSEKRYFKIHIRTHASKHLEDYLALFKHVDQSDAYQEENAIRYMDKQGSSQRFAILKHRLYEKILDALEAFARGGDEALTLRHELNRSKVLIERGLMRAAHASIAKVIRKAEHIAEYAIAMDAKLMLAHTQIKNEEQEKSNTLLSLERYQRLLELRAEVFTQLRLDPSGLNARADVREQLGEVLRVEDLPQAHQFLAHHTLSALEHAAGDAAASLLEVRACISIAKESDLALLDALSLPNLLANELHGLVKLGQSAEAKQSLQVLLNLDPSQYRAHEFMHIKGLQLQSLLYYALNQDITHLQTQLQERMAEYEALRWSHDPQVRAGLDYDIALYHQQEGSRRKALKSLNRVLNDGEISRNEDIYHRSLVLMTLLHAESMDRQWMVHSARALKRYLIPRDLLGPVEEALLDYVVDLRRAKSDLGEVRALHRYIDALTVLIQRDEHSRNFEHFDFLAWAQARLSELEEQGMVA